MDYYTKIARFDVPHGISFIFMGDICLIPTGLISSLSALHLMNKGSQDFLVVVRDVEAKVFGLDQVPVVMT